MKKKTKKTKKQPAHPNFVRVYKFLTQPDSMYCENCGRFNRRKFKKIKKGTYLVKHTLSGEVFIQD